MEEIMLSVANYGFPMAVTAFLLVRIENRLLALDNGIHDLVRAVERR